MGRFDVDVAKLRVATLPYLAVNPYLLYTCTVQPHRSTIFNSGVGCGTQDFKTSKDDLTKCCTMFAGVSKGDFYRRDVHPPIYCGCS